MSEDKGILGNPTGVTPTGSQVLLDFLTEQEMSSTSLILPGSSSSNRAAGEPHQAIVLSVGPAVKLSDWGFNVGDRVVVSGHGVMAPKYDSSERLKFFMEPHCVKAVIQTASSAKCCSGECC